MKHTKQNETSPAEYRSHTGQQHTHGHTTTDTPTAHSVDFCDRGQQQPQICSFKESEVLKMASSVQLSREALCDGLDHLSLQQLRLMDQLIRYNMMLEERMRSGYFLLSKTRYSMGSSAVSSLQLPSPDSETESLTAVMTSPVVLEGYKGDIMYHKVDVSFKDPVTPLPDDDEGEELYEESKDKEQKIRKRGTITAKEQTLKGENSETEKKSKNAKKSGRKHINRDPIRWFSALPQQTLRQAQQDFRSSVSLIAECATTQSKLRTVNKEYSRLQEIKTRLDSEDKEE